MSVVECVFGIYKIFQNLEKLQSVLVLLKKILLKKSESTNTPRSRLFETHQKNHERTGSPGYSKPLEELLIFTKGALGLGQVFESFSKKLRTMILD
jgi:hypothetical protein